MATIRSEQPASTALPAKQRPWTIAIRGTSPESRAQSAKARVSSAETTGWSVSPGRPPPPSAKRIAGSRIRSISSKRRSFLRWPSTPWVPASTV